jgi:hypothetical protein
MGACDIAALAFVTTSPESMLNIAYDPAGASKASIRQASTGPAGIFEALKAESSGTKISVQATDLDFPAPIGAGIAASPATEPFPYLEVVIAVLAFLALLGAGMWYQRRVRRAHSKAPLKVPLAVIETKKVR